MEWAVETANYVKTSNPLDVRGFTYGETTKEIPILSGESRGSGSGTWDR